MAPEQRQERTGNRSSENDRATTEVEWERGSGGIEPRGDAVPRPRPPRVSESATGDEQTDRGGAGTGRGGEEPSRRRSSETQPSGPGSSVGGKRRYGAASRRQTGGRGREGQRKSGDRRGRDERQSVRDESGGRSGAESERGEHARGPGGESTNDRIGRPGNRRSPVGDTDTGSPHAGSQRGSDREEGLGGRIGGQFGGNSDRGSGNRSGRDESEQFGGRRGGDRRDRRYGSRRGHGTQRRDRRTE